VTGELNDSYAPQLLLAVEIVDLKMNKALFTEYISYRQNGGVRPPTFIPAPRYSVRGREELMRNPQLAAEGFRAAIPLIAEHVRQSLAR